MSGQWLEVDNDDEIRQGDVIRRLSMDGSRTEWGFVITADCDIAQRKAGDRFTYVEIASAEHYLEAFWAPEQLRRFVERQSRTAAEQLGGVMKRSSLTIDTITPSGLVTWLGEQTVDEIAQALNRTGRPLDDRLTRTLHGLKAAIAPSDDTSLERFKSARRALGDNSAKIGDALRTAFEGERGFPDFFLLPELPYADGVGYVVLLRAFASLPAADLFMTEVDARIAGRSDAFHRIGRLSDGLRFAVMQKLAFLFLRIGLVPSFEEACRSANELVVETIMGGELP
jgi:hypothetical protein